MQEAAPQKGSSSGEQFLPACKNDSGSRPQSLRRRKESPRHLKGRPGNRKIRPCSAEPSAPRLTALPVAASQARHPGNRLPGSPPRPPAPWLATPAAGSLARHPGRLS